LQKKKKFFQKWIRGNKGGGRGPAGGPRWPKANQRAICKNTPHQLPSCDAFVGPRLICRGLQPTRTFLAGTINVFRAGISTQKLWLDFSSEGFRWLWGFRKVEPQRALFGSSPPPPPPPLSPPPSPPLPPPPPPPSPPPPPPSSPPPPPPPSPHSHEATSPMQKEFESSSQDLGGLRNESFDVVPQMRRAGRKLRPHQVWIRQSACQIGYKVGSLPNSGTGIVFMCSFAPSFGFPLPWLRRGAGGSRATKMKVVWTSRRGSWFLSNIPSAWQKHPKG